MMTPPPPPPPFATTPAAFKSVAFVPYERPALTKGYLVPLDKKPARLPYFIGVLHFIGFLSIACCGQSKARRLKRMQCMDSDEM